MKKQLVLIIVLALIVVSIFFIQMQKPIRSNKISEIITMTSAQKDAIYPKAVELVTPNGYININNITLKENIGKKIILLDFWTYSCINCQRTTPYLNKWHDDHSDSGLLIVGVHTPEFEFEKDIENVKKATLKYGIKYPVVLDNEYQTWSAYGNRYWPRKYLIDIDGYVVYDHIGEGGYAETEAKIKELLNERSKRLNILSTMPQGSQFNASEVDFRKIGTPEIYFGYGFSREQLGNIQGLLPGKIVNYTLPAMRKNNFFYLEGEWKNEKDYMEAQGEAKILLRYTAKDINIVAGSENISPASVFIDGVFKNNISVGNHDLYLIDSANGYGTREIKILVDKGFKAYTFTFG